MKNDENSGKEPYPLSLFLKNLSVNKKFGDPFNDEFDFEEITEAIKAFEENNELKYDKEGYETLQAINQLNKINEALLLKIETEIIESSLTQSQLIEGVFQYANLSFLNVFDITIKAAQRSNSEADPIRDMTIFPSLSVQDSEGQNISLQVAIDDSVDVAMEILDLIYSFQSDLIKKAPSQPKSVLIKIHKIFLITAQLISVRNVFRSFQFEFGGLKITENKKISFFYSHPTYAVLKEAGAHRATKLVYEYLIRTGQLHNDLEIETPITYTSNGCLRIRSKTIKSKNTRFRQNLAQLDLFFNYLENVEFEKLKNFSLEKMYVFLSALRGLFEASQNFIELPQTENESVYKNVPYKIKRTDLIKFLKKETGLSKQIIAELLGTLSTSFYSDFSLWKTPFLSVGKYLMYILPSISGGHLEYLLDRLIIKYIPYKSRVTHFLKYLENRIDGFSSKYEMEKLSSKEAKQLIGKESADETLIYILKSKILIFQVSLFEYPIESEEYHQVLYKFWNYSQKLNATAEIIKIKSQERANFKDKEIIRIGITNYLSLSGFEMESCHFIDPFLVTNYFDVGGLNRARVSYNVAGKQKNEIISTFKYYKNEDEFNQNITSFCLSPEPIAEIASRIFYKDFDITNSGSNIGITQQGIQFDQIGDTIDHQINEIDYYLKQLYYFEQDLKKLPNPNSLIKRKLEYLIPITLNFLSISKTDREHRIFLLSKLNNTKYNGLGYLIFSLQKEIDILSQKKITEDPLRPELDKKIDVKKIIEDAIKKSFDHEDKVMALSNIDLAVNLSKKELESVIAYLYDELGVLRMRYYNEDELELLLIQTSILAGFIKSNEKYHSLLYTVFLNYIDVLNFNYQYQKARDVSEEILAFSFKNEPNSSLGWLCLFKCNLKQKNLNDAAFYCALFVSSVATSPEVPDFKFEAALYNSFLFFRDAKIEKLAKLIYEILKSRGGNDYEQQKITLGYFNMKLLSLYEDSSDLVREVKDFLSKAKDSIIKYGQEGILPWLGLLFNIKNGLENRKIDIPEEIHSSIEEFKELVDKETLKEFESMFFPVLVETKKTLEKALTGVFESRYFEDFASELQNLQLLAKNTLVLSLDPVDIDGLLLSGLALNDSFLTFTELNQEGKTPFKSGKHKEISKFLKDYSGFTLNKLELNKDQILLWIFEVRNSIYSLHIYPDKSYKVLELKGWDLQEMEHWLKGINDYVFADKVDYSINIQEQEYSNQLTQLAFSKLEIDSKYDDLLVYFDLSLSIFPHNLIQLGLNEKASIQNSHTQLVKTKISELKSDFIGMSKSITNIFSLEWFIENCKKFRLSKSDFSISGWSPLEDEDFTLMSSASKLEPVIEQFGGQFYCDLVPKEPLDADLNFFLAHGDKGIEGFRSVYSREDDQAHAIVRGSGIKRIFGSGTIAVLFICNSASISPEAHSQKLVSFINEIVGLGYKAVIAPAWKLNSDIAAVWMKHFLDYFMDGQKISNCVSLANRSIAFNGYNEYNGFYDPSGWSAMHLYGNPDIYLEDE